MDPAYLLQRELRTCIVNVGFADLKAAERFVSSGFAAVAVLEKPVPKLPLVT